jgi:hypothetical protein
MRFIGSALAPDLHDRQLSKQDERWLIDRMQIENVWMTGF